MTRSRTSPKTSGEWTRCSNRSNSVRPRWTVFELAGHMDISIGLTRMVIAARTTASRGVTRSASSSSRARRSPGGLRLRLHDGRGQDAGRHAGRARRDVRQVDLGVPSPATRDGRFRLLRVDAPRRVRDQPCRRGSRSRDRPDRRDRTRVHRHTRRDRGHRVDPRRAAGAAHRRRTAGRPRRRPGVDPCRLRPRRPRRPASAAARAER